MRKALLIVSVAVFGLSFGGGGSRPSPKNICVPAQRGCILVMY
jgi:hypothetical protein